MDNWITIKSATQPIDLAVVHAHLEAEGIACFLRNEFTTQINPFYSNAIGGVQLQVKESDLNKAMNVLNEAGLTESESSAELAKEANAPPDTRTAKGITCPGCGSDEVYIKRQMSKWAIFIYLLFVSFPAPIYRTSYYCHNCGCEFRIKKKEAPM